MLPCIFGFEMLGVHCRCICFRENCKLIVIDLSKKQAHDADPKAMQKINLIGNLDRNMNIAIFFHMYFKDVVKNLRVNV